MSHFVPPVKDMIFVLDQFIGLDQLSIIKGFDEIDKEFLESIYDSASEIASEVIAPTNVDGDRIGVSLEKGKVSVPRGYKEAYAAYVSGGWPTLSCNPEFGGQGLPSLVSMPVNEMVMAANFSWSHLVLLTNSVVRAVETHADPSLKDLFLKKLIAGEYSGTMVLTEPQAGSDLSALTTSAVPNGDHYKITGQKIFITWGEHDLSENIIHMVLARLPDAPEGVKGISLFLVPKYLVNDDSSLGERNSLEAVSIEHKLGIHGCATCVMNFEDATGYLVGEINQGLSCMFTMMNDARIGVACESVAIAERAYQQALTYAKDRVQGEAHGQKGRTTIIHHPDVRRMLLKMRSQIEMMRVLVYVNTLELDLSEDDQGHSQRADLLTPITKGWCSELCQEITSIGLQIHGGMGYIEETGAAQHFRDSRITTIYEGTTGIQANDLISRKVIRDQGKELRRLITEISTEIKALDSNEQRLQLIKEYMIHSIAMIEKSLDYILQEHPKDPFLAGSVSYNFLMMMGTFMGGWVASRSAALAIMNLKNTEDSEFYEAKLVSSTFFIEQCLPLVDSYSKSLMSGSVSTMTLTEDQF
jgi:alkylation response protein AidB-like acyl-CoA dehydrogenase